MCRASEVPQERECTLSSLPESSDDLTNRDERRRKSVRLMSLVGSNSVETASGLESVSGHLSAELGRDLVLDLSKRVEAASGREKLFGNLCAVFSRGRESM